MKEDDINSNTPNPDDLGTIRVQCDAVKITGVRAFDSEAWSPVPISLPGDTPIHEKAKKEGTHIAQ